MVRIRRRERLTASQARLDKVFPAFAFEGMEMSGDVGGKGPRCPAERCDVSTVPIKDAH